MLRTPCPPTSIVAQSMSAVTDAHSRKTPPSPITPGARSRTRRSTTEPPEPKRADPMLTPQPI